MVKLGHQSSRTWVGYGSGAIITSKLLNILGKLSCVTRDGFTSTLPSSKNTNVVSI